MNVSVIIPSNGNRESVFKSIKSVRDQVFNFKVEIIVVINGDLFEKLIIKKLNELSIIKVIYCDIPNGNAARDLGIQNSKHDYICFLDDDDLWRSDKLKVQISQMQLDNNSFSYTGRLIDSPYKKYYSISKPFENQLNKEIFERNFIGGFSSVCITKDLYKKSDGLDLSLGCFQDYDFYLRCLDHSGVTIIDEPLVIYSQHFGLKISNNYKVNKLSVQQILDKYKGHVYFKSLKKSLKKMVFRKGIKYFNLKMVIFSQTL